MDLAAADRFNDIKSMDTGFSRSAAAFNFHDQRSRRHRTEHRLALLRIDKRNAQAEVRHVKGRSNGRRRYAPADYGESPQRFFQFREVDFEARFPVTRNGRITDNFVLMWIGFLIPFMVNKDRDTYRYNSDEAGRQTRPRKALTQLRAGFGAGFTYLLN